MLFRSNSRNPRLSWYGLQGDRVTLATAQKDGKIYARAIIWQDGEMIDRDGEVIYSGKIADRLYHYNHAGRAALITYLEAAGIPYKRTETWGDGVFQLPDGRTFDTSGQTIRAKIKTAKNTGGLYPFVDTLPIVTAKYASNRVQEGQNYKIQDVNGRRHKVGTYALTNYTETAELIHARHAVTLLYPDGSTKIATRQQVGEDWKPAYVGNYPFTIYNAPYVLKAYSIEGTATIIRESRYGVPVSIPIQVCTYPADFVHTYDSESRTTSIGGLQRIFITGKGYVPLNSVELTRRGQLRKKRKARTTATA